MRENPASLFGMWCSLIVQLVLTFQKSNAVSGAMHRKNTIDINIVPGQTLHDMTLCCGLAQVSYMILQRVSPVTHSIGNCLKRVIVIVASVLFFQNPMGRQNMIGAGCRPLLEKTLHCMARSL